MMFRASKSVASVDTTVLLDAEDRVAVLWEFNLFPVDQVSQKKTMLNRKYRPKDDIQCGQKRRTRKWT